MWKVALWGLCVCALAGCRTTSPTPEVMATATIEESMTIAAPDPILPDTNAPPLIPSPPPPPATAHIVKPSAPVEVNTWIPLDNWAQRHGLGSPTKVPSNPHPAYQWRTTNGSLALKVGSHVAQYDGLACLLGYAPKLIGGVPHIHALDARKSLQPLMNAGETPSWLGLGTIVIDPGHGGVDLGTRSVFNQQYEKIYTLDWALRLRALLVARGWNVVLTRSTDREVSLPERVALAERHAGALFISLHFNSGSPNHQLAGIETYCLTPPGLPSNLLRSSEDDWRQVFPNNAFDEQNLQLAYRVHRRLVGASGAPDRGVRRARFMGVLRNQNRPAVLIEGGYLSNLAEARKIAQPEFRQALAEAVADALK